MARPGFKPLCVLFFGALASTPLAGPADVAEAPSGSRQSAPSSLEGALALVRIYPDVLEGPSAYEGVPVTIHEDSFALDEADIATSSTYAFVVLVGTDQTDPTAARELGGSIQSWGLADGPRFKVRRRTEAMIQPVYDESGKILKGPRLVPRGLKTLRISVSDALGNPLNGASLNLTLSPSSVVGRAPGVLLEPLTVDNGIIAVPEPAGILNTASIRLEHPEYGVAECDRYRILWGAGDPEGPEPPPIVAPLVRQGTPARERALNGVVVDPEGQPVAGASLSCRVVRTPGGGLINVQSTEEEFRVPTDEAGRFCFYAPLKFRTKERGQPIPPGSMFHVRIEPPLGSALLPRAGAFSNNEEAVIALERTTDANFHTFVFIDANGPIADLDRLRRVRVNGRTKGAEVNSPIDIPTLLRGGAIPPGTYTAQIWENGADVQFQPLEVALDSPRELVFRLVAQAVYEGQVLDAVTGRPAPDSFVLSSGVRCSDRKVSDFTPDEWALLHALPPAPALDDPNLAPLKRLYVIDAIVRTDLEGRFRLTVPAGKSVRALLVFDQDYLAVERYANDLKPDANGVVSVPPIRLVPAAKANVEIQRPRGRAWFRATWIVDKQAVPKWASPLWDENHRSWFDDAYKVYGGDKPGWISVPAEVPFGLRLECSPHDPVILDGPFTLRKGEQHDLGVFTPPASQDDPSRPRNAVGGAAGQTKSGSPSN